MYYYMQPHRKISNSLKSDGRVDQAIYARKFPLKSPNLCHEIWRYPSCSHIRPHVARGTFSCSGNYFLRKFLSRWIVKRSSVTTSDPVRILILHVTRSLKVGADCVTSYGLVSGQECVSLEFILPSWVNWAWSVNRMSGRICSRVCSHAYSRTRLA